MAESVYRRKTIGSFTSIMKNRSGLLGQTQWAGGKSIQARMPAFIYVTGKCNKCAGCTVGGMTLPRDERTWDETYKPTIKPNPLLKSVQIEYGGDWGIAQKVTATIECFHKNDFERVTDAFLIPGNSISVRFGYTSKKWHYGDGSVSLSGFRVASFSFSATSGGSWICTFTAVSSATAIKNTDFMSTVGKTGMEYIMGGSIEGARKGQVSSIAELIAYDSQRNGQESIERLKESNVLDKGDIANYDPGPVENSGAAIAIYTGDHLRNWLGRQAAKVAKWGLDMIGKTDETETMNNQVYVTLGYVVNRLYNDQIMKTMVKGIGSKDKSDYKKLKIEFHKEYSKSLVPSDMRSGDPTAILLLGVNKGNYLNSDGEGIDFEIIKKGSLDPVRSVKGGGDGLEIDLSKILIHRDVVLEGLSQAIKKREANSDNADVKDTKEEVINIIDFFNNISDAISEATGGALALRLVEEVEDSNRTKLYLVDQNYGGTSSIDCVVLNPIDGDGSTRSCEIQSNVGSQEFKASMFVGNSKKGDPVTGIRKCDGQVDGARSEVYGDAVDRLSKHITDPGLLAKDAFDAKQIAALKSIMTDIHRNKPDAKKTETIHWPGLSIQASIDGVWGIIPGCGISTTQLPDNWRALKVYFMVTRVTHVFQDSDWQTDIEGIMSYYKKLNYVKL